MTAAARFHTLAARGIRVTLDLAVGHVRALVVTRDGRDLVPLHVAPWIDDPAVTADPSIPANLRFLSGDFFCAPFSASDVEEGPAHGWPANSPWRLVEEQALPDGATALYRLERTVMGAVLEKRFTLRHDHPFLYQTHAFQGGDGAVPVASHAMVHLPDGGRLAFSAKSAIETPGRPLEPDPAIGRSRLAYPAKVLDPTAFPDAGGGRVDLTRYPFAERHEDFVTLIERADAPFGWFAASRPRTRDAVLSLKSPRDFPVTFLWFSNGGRDYPPWNGRHTGVLGIEEGRANSVYGHRASVAPNALSAAGIPTALALRPAGTAGVRHVLGVHPLAASGAAIAGVALGEGGLDVVDEAGGRTAVPFDAGFLAEAG